MQQYFFETTIELHDTLHFVKEQSHHIKHVMRMKSGDVVKVVDCNKTPFLVKLLVEQEVSAEVFEQLEIREDAINIILIQGMIKGDRWDVLLQKACELGVTTIVPMVSKRTIVKMNDKVDKKVERYNKIAREACEQSKREHLVRVSVPIQFKEIEKYKSSLNLVAYEHADVAAQKLKDTLKQHPKLKDVTIVIGSEGGFEEAEVNELLSKGFECISLGSRILRAETAAMSLINSLMFYYE